MPLEQVFVLYAVVAQEEAFHIQKLHKMGVSWLEREEEASAEEEGRE